MGDCNCAKKKMHKKEEEDQDLSYKKKKKIKIMYQTTYRNVHQMLKHMVLSQKNAARKKKCAMIAEKEK